MSLSNHATLGSTDQPDSTVSVSRSWFDLPPEIWYYIFGLDLEVVRYASQLSRYFHDLTKPLVLKLMGSRPVSYTELINYLRDVKASPSCFALVDWPVNFTQFKAKVKANNFGHYSIVSVEACGIVFRAVPCSIRLSVPRVYQSRETELSLTHCQYHWPLESFRFREFAEDRIDEFEEHCIDEFEEFLRDRFDQNNSGSTNTVMVPDFYTWSQILKHRTSCYQLDPTFYQRVVIQELMTALTTMVTEWQHDPTNRYLAVRPLFYIGPTVEVIGCRSNLIWRKAVNEILRPVQIYDDEEKFNLTDPSMDPHKLIQAAQQIYALVRNHLESA